jgi:hypothetical protein
MSTISVTAGDNPQGAANSLQPGDTLLFKTGTHYGRISIPVDGVTIQGEAGAVLDGTQALDSDNWEEATDSDDYCSLAGTGVWRLQQSQPVWILTDGGENQVFRIDSDYINVRQTSGYYYMTAYEAMAVPNNARPGPDYGADWWNGIEAMFCYNRQNGYLYLRYRDGHRPPNGMRWSGSVNDHRDPPTDGGTVIMLYHRQNIMIKNLTLRGCVDSIATWDCLNVIIDGCTFTAFDYANRVYGTSENIKITNCSFDLRLIGTNVCPPIAKISSEDPYPDARTTAYHQYTTWKFFHDESDSTHGSGMSVVPDEGGNPKNIEFAHNYVRCCNFGADVGGDGCDVHHNRVEHVMDMPFQRTASYGGRNVKLHDNYVKEAGYTLIRWHGADKEAGDNYVYNNQVVSIDQVSDFVFLAPDASGGAWEPEHSYLRIWFYHNTFSGGNSVWLITDMLSMPGFICVNNLLANAGLTANAATKPPDDDPFDKKLVKQWPPEVGPFDYNAMNGSLGAGGSWYGSHNIINMPVAWPTDVIQEECYLPEDHPAKESGIDISQPFVLNGVTYEALPGFEPGYFSGARPDCGWIEREENGGDIVAATLIVEPDSVVPGGDVEISWTGSASALDWWACYKIGGSNDYEKYGWAYTSCGRQSPTIVTPSGTCLFTMPTELGNYEFRLFANDGSQLMATSNQVTVEEAEPEPEPPPDEERILAWIIPIRDPEVLKQIKKPKS